MKFKEIILFLALCLLASCLWGCKSANPYTIENNPSVTDSNKENQSTPPSIDVNDGNDIENNTPMPSHMETDLSSGVSVKAQVMIPDGTDYGSMPTYKASFQEFDFEGFANDFMQGKMITKEVENPDPEGVGIYKFKEASDGSYVASSTGYGNISFSSRTCSNTLDVFIRERSYNKVNIETNEIFHKDLSFSSQKEALELVKGSLDKLGIEVFSEYDCYSLEGKWLQETELKFQKEDNEYFSQFGEGEKNLAPIEFKDCYYFKFYGAVKNMPITDKARDYKFAQIPAPNISAIISRDGIEEFDILNALQSETENDGSKILTLNEALAKLDEHYNTIIMEGNYTVTEIKLEYIPIPVKDSYQLVPAWRFIIDHAVSMAGKVDIKEMETDIMKEQFLINATNGEQVLQEVLSE